MSDPAVYTIGWICAIATEYVAAQAFLDEEYDDGPDNVAANDSNDYTLGRIGKHNVVIAVLPEGEYGTASAATVAAGILHSFPNVRIGLMVGIGGGAPSAKYDIRLGDIVVSVSGNDKGGVFQYDFGKTIQEQQFKTTGFLNQPPTVLRTAVSGLRAQYERKGHRLQEIIDQALEDNPKLRKNYGKPSKKTDRLYLSSVIHPSDTEEACSTSCGQDPHRLVYRSDRAEDDDDPTIHYGLIASANQLMKDAVVRDWLAKEYGILCFEMEAAGLMNNFPCLVIRGICDYSDTHKNEDWQRYAAMVAAAYAKALLSRIHPNKIEMERKLSDAVSHLKDVAVEQRDLAQEYLKIAQHTVQERLSDRQWKCLQLFRLTRVDKDATYESYKGRVEDRVEGTCEWVLQHDNFRAWLDNDTGPLLITADPGCGKSVLAKYLVENVLPKASTVCYFFFKEQDQNTVRQALCALLHQLFYAKPVLIKHAMDRFDIEGNSLISSTSSLWSILSDIVEDPGAGSIIIVLDALDECVGSELKDMIRNLEKQCRRSPASNGKLKCLMTTRPYEEILSAFRNHFDDSSRIRIPGEDESEAISQEVNLVIVHRVDRLAKEKQLSSESKKELAQRLMEVQYRTYLWVYLVFDFLQCRRLRNTKKGIASAMQVLPTNVNAAYEQILSKSKDDRMVRRALAIILAAWRPLTLAEMNVAMSLDSTAQRFDDLDLETEKDFLTSLRDWCGLFVSVYQREVHFLHRTAREFLLAEITISASEKRDLRWQHSITMHQGHAELAELCVRFLNLSGDTSIVKSDEIQLAKCSFGKKAFIKYAAQFWMFHFRGAKFCSQDVDIINLVSEISDPSSSLSTTWLLSYFEGEEYGFEENPGFTTTLQVVAYFGVTAVVESLLSNTVDLEKTDMTRQLTPLLWAIEMHDTKIAEMLLSSGANPNAQAADLGSALSYAACYCDEAMVKLLLDKGANVNAEIPRHGSALGATASSYEERSDFVEILLDRGADIDAHVDRYGTALGAAASRGNKDTVELLLKRGANVNKQGGIYGCALGAAVGYCYTTEKLFDIVALLLDFGADIDAPCGCDGTALGTASRIGVQAVVELLLSRGADLHKVGGDFTNAVAAAAYAGHKGIVQLLLDRGADIHVEGRYFANALASAAYEGQTEVVELLSTKGADIHQRGGDHGNPIGSAVCGGRLEMFDLLLKKGADLFSVNKAGSTLLNLAAQYGRLEITELLLQQGVQLDLADNRGRTPLFSAAYNGHAEVVELLLKNGAKLTPDKKGWTPLNAASSLGHFEVIQLLLDMNADTTAANKWGATPTYTASIQGHARVVQLLLERGADIDVSNDDGETPLAAASKHNQVAVVQVLLSHGAVSFADKYGWTPLMKAANEGHVDVVGLLSGKGSSVTDADPDGWTPLLAAAASGHFQVVELLLSRGANLSITNVYGWTPLHCAADNGYVEVVKLLLGMGAYDPEGGLVPRYGTVANLFAFKGHTDLLRFIVDHRNADLQGTDSHKRNSLHFAVRGGHLDTFEYVKSQGLVLTSSNLTRDDWTSLAASSGSLEIMRIILNLESVPFSECWNALHWACRVGSVEMVELLISRGWPSHCVKVRGVEGRWTPLAIALLHGHREMLQKLSATSQTALGLEVNSANLEGDRHHGVSCSACLHDIYGPRFHCRTCLDFDCCFMCHFILEHLHENHGWERFDRFDSTYRQR